MTDKNKNHEEQQLNVQEEQVEAAVESALTSEDQEGAGDVNIYKCGSSV
ncbi:MAG: hypothetical protein WCC10_11330 [Tumebacillaceae bacterium]